MNFQDDIIDQFTITINKGVKNILGPAGALLDTIKNASNIAQIKVREAVPRSRNSGKHLAEKVQEYDSVRREATVYLFTRPVNGRSDDDDSFRHWSLVFEFEDSTIRYVEGNDYDGELVASYFKESPRDAGKYYELGDFVTSPKLLRAIAVKNELNYTPYCFARNNCQQWAKQFANQLGDEDILENLNNFSTMVEAYPLFAYSASVSGSSWKSLS